MEKGRDMAPRRIHANGACDVRVRKKVVLPHKMRFAFFHSHTHSHKTTSQKTILFLATEVEATLSGWQEAATPPTE